MSTEMNRDQGTQGRSPAPRRQQRQTHAGVLAGPTLAAALAAALPCGCTTEQLYATARGWQHHACDRLADADQRTRCLADTATSYSDYRQQRRDAIGTP